MTIQTDLFKSNPASRPLAAFPIPFVFPYRAKIVKWKGRVPKDAMFVGKDHVLIPEVMASVAYRISFPATRTNFSEVKCDANEIDILHHDGKFYWPFEAA